MSKRKQRVGVVPRADTVATHTVTFGKKAHRPVPRPEPKPLGRIPRVTRLLALAHRIDGMIRSGEIRDRAEAARLVGVTRARMTQISNLLLLAPDIQETTLNLSDMSNGSHPVTERTLRRVAAHAIWQQQRARWRMNEQ